MERKGRKKTAASGRSLTERENVEKALAESARRYRDLLENSGTRVVIVDRSGRYLRVNQGAASVLGKTEEEVVGKSMFDLLPRDTAQRCLDFRLFVDLSTAI